MAQSGNFPFPPQANCLANGVAGIPKGTVSRLLTVDSKVALGAFRAGENLGACYEELISIPVDTFPTSIKEMTSSLDEAIDSQATGPGNFTASVAMSFTAAVERRELSRQQAAKNKAQTLEIARARLLEQKEEIQSHKTAMRVAATREKEKQSERDLELVRCRSEAYLAEVGRAAAKEKHERLMEQAAANGENEAKFERALKSVRSTEKSMRAGKRKACRRSQGRTAPPHPRHVDAVARSRCAQNATKMRNERSRLVAKACEALRLARQNVRKAMDVPYPDEKSRQKMLKGRGMVLGALTELSDLVDGRNN